MLAQLTLLLFRKREIFGRINSKTVRFLWRCHKRRLRRRALMRKPQAQPPMPRMPPLIAARNLRAKKTSGRGHNLRQKVLLLSEKHQQDRRSKGGRVMFFSFFRWLRGPNRRRPHVKKQQRGSRLILEPLEDRTVPSTLQLLANPSFSSGALSWNRSGDFYAGTNLSNYRTGPGYAAGGVDTAGQTKNNASGSIYQQFTIPSNATSVTASWYRYITSNETTTSTQYDKLYVRVLNSSGSVLSTLKTLSNLNKGSGYVQDSVNLSGYIGQTVRLQFFVTTDSSLTSIFRLDDVSVFANVPDAANTAPTFSNPRLNGVAPFTSSYAQLGQTLYFSGSVSDDVGLSVLTVKLSGPKGNDFTVSSTWVSGTYQSLSPLSINTSNNAYAGVPGNYMVTLFAKDTAGKLSSVSWNLSIHPTPAVRNGVDFAGTSPGPDALKSAGYSFVVRYVSTPGSWKNITRNEAQTLQNAGIDIILVFESYANRMVEGYSAGVQDAYTAIATATAAGAPADFFCYFACDFDASASDQPAINSYLDGAASVMGLSRVGFYGGYTPLKAVLDAGKASKGWQTYAWSRGQFDPRATLYQYKNGATVNGASVDLDYGYGSDLGQWSVRRQSARTGLAIADACARAGRDSRFGTVVVGSLGTDVNWSPDWELRWVDFNFSGGRKVRIFHATYKADASLRYTTFWDPDAGSWTNWERA